MYQGACYVTPILDLMLPAEDRRHIPWLFEQPWHRTLCEWRNHPHLTIFCFVKSTILKSWETEEMPILT